MSAITIKFVEDEMLTLYRNGKFLSTIYADCPEQARDFLKDKKDTKLATVDEWCFALSEFAATWASKYPDEGY